MGQGYSKAFKPSFFVVGLLLGVCQHMDINTGQCVCTSIRIRRGFVLHAMVIYVFMFMVMFMVMFMFICIS